MILVRSTRIFGHLQLKLQSVKKNQTVCFAFFYKQYKYSTTSHRTKTFLQGPQLTCGSPCVRVVLVHARTSLPADIPFSTPRPSVSLLLRSGLEPPLFKRPQLHFRTRNSRHALHSSSPSCSACVAASGSAAALVIRAPVPCLSRLVLTLSVSLTPPLSGSDV